MPAVGRYTRCYECNTLTPIGEPTRSGLEPFCAACDDQGDDPYLGVVVDVTLCPHRTYKESCGDEEHHWGTGMHETEVDLEHPGCPPSPLRPSVGEIEEAIKIGFADWAQQCHAVSLAIVKSGLLPGSRVARGACKGVLGQHSWVVIGPDCYDRDAAICDPILWSYRDDVEGVWYGTARHGWHHPHGAGSIWEYGRPADPTGPVIDLAVDPGSRAAAFLKMAAPHGLDRRGWMMLANGPMEGWPAREVIEAMYRTDELRAAIPIDIVGMATDLNPNGLYLPGDEVVT